VQKKAEVKRFYPQTATWIVMAPSLEKSATEDLQQLSGLSGWLSSFSVVLQAMVSNPLESGVYLLLLSLEEFDRVNSLSGLIQTMALLYITRKVVQLSYLELVPSAKTFPLLLPASPIERMASVTGLWLIGSTYFGVFLVVPGICFAIASCLAQQFVVLEGTRMIAAIDKSTALTKGNIGTITKYLCIWPPITAAMLLVATTGVNALLEFYNSVSHLATTVHIAGAVCLTTIGLATQVIATRIFVYLMHKSGRSSAIETKIAEQQVA
jgi:hypothetical protein